MKGTERSSSGLALLVRALDLFLLFADGKPQTPHEMAEQLGVPRTTLHRYLNLLLAEGLLVRDADHSYRLGLRVLELSFALRKETDLASLALPVMRRLMAETGETVLLVSAAGDQATCLERVEGEHPLGSSYERGQRFPFHAGAAGKALLACQNTLFIQGILGQPLSRFTEYTVTDPTALRADLDLVRLRGYATSVGELQHGVGSVAVPILDPHGQAIAALEVTAPSIRIEDGRVPRLAEQIRAAAQTISEYVC